eukprot:CAMPEP_0178864206 /NCGR_PEP_ID=MMETSP0747-20121128/3763_1 /TAXON_ID=913974 /ORGANISM="Nitzschia punctata, Strain CCMP561" /LENGTH=70 /DNA_ID=CAMNT_0020530931 /DNA_START=403 /DNA_END=612 /DNA_ORIENTATION=+
MAVRQCPPFIPRATYWFFQNLGFKLLNLGNARFDPHHVSLALRKATFHIKMYQASVSLQKYLKVFQQAWM